MSPWVRLCSDGRVSNARDASAGLALLSMTRHILSGLLTLLHNPGMQRCSYSLQAFCRNLIRGILQGVPVGIIEINDKYCWYPCLQKRPVIILHGMLVLRNEFAAISQAFRCLP